MDERTIIKTESSEVSLKQLIKEVVSAYFESLVNNKEHVIWDENLFVGSINLMPNDSGVEIGYWLDGRCIGSGYLTVTARALADYYKKFLISCMTERRLIILIVKLY